MPTGAAGVRAGAASPPDRRPAPAAVRIGVVGDAVASVEPASGDEPGGDSAYVGGADYLVLPGLVNAHQHGRLLSTVALGVPDMPLECWLTALLGAPGGDPYADTFEVARNMVDLGVTATVQMHTTSTATVSRYEEEVRAVLAAYAEVGVRVGLALDVRDQGVPVYGLPASGPDGRVGDLSASATGLDLPVPGVDEVIEVALRLRADAVAGRLGHATVMLGPPGIPWCSDGLLATIARVSRAEGLPVQTHLLESEYQRLLGRTRHPGGSVAMLDELGLVRSGVSFAHGVFLDDGDMRPLAAGGAAVVTNPSSNLRLHNGVAPVRSMLEAGVTVGLGSDSNCLDGGDDLWSELRLLRALQRRRDVRDRGLDPASVVRIATGGGAGTIAPPGPPAILPGRPADLILVDMRRLGPLAEGVDLADALVGLSSRQAVSCVVVGGEVLKQPPPARAPATGRAAGRPAPAGAGALGRGSGGDPVPVAARIGAAGRSAVNAPVGRGAEARTIETFLDGVDSGCRVQLLEGEVGIGKTTLLRCAAEEARRRGFVVLMASPVPDEHPLEFAALADLLEGVHPAAIDGLPVPQQQALRVAVWREELPGSPVDPRTIAAAFLTVARTLAGAARVLLVVDDIAWLDLPTASVVSFALRRARAIPLGVLGSVRTGWDEDRPAVPALEHCDGVRIDRVAVGPLTLGGTRRLLESRLGLAPDRTTLIRLHEASGGNPMFALELASTSAFAGSRSGPETLAVPQSLRRLVTGRIGALSARCRDLLLAAALSTSDRSRSLVLAAAADPATAEDDLDGLIKSGILIGRGDRLVFGHPLLRSVVIEEARPSAGAPRICVWQAASSFPKRGLVIWPSPPPARTRRSPIRWRAPPALRPGGARAGSAPSSLAWPRSSLRPSRRAIAGVGPCSRPSTGSRLPIPPARQRFSKGSSAPSRTGRPVPSCCGASPGTAATAGSLSPSGGRRFSSRSTTAEPTPTCAPRSSATWRLLQLTAGTWPPG